MNPISRPHGLAAVWNPWGTSVAYWPLTFSTYWLELHCWGLDHPGGFHLVNIALHAVCALAVWRLLERVRLPGAMAGPGAGAFVAAAIFALHPVNVDTAAWVSQLKGLLALLFTVLSVIFYLSDEERNSRWSYSLAVGLFLLAALAKGSGLTLPCVLLVLAWWRRGKVTLKDVRRVLPYLLIAVVFAWIELVKQETATMGEPPRVDGLLARAATAGWGVWFYIGKLIWPANLSLVYRRWTINPRNIVAYLPGFLLLVVLAIAWVRRKTWGRSIVAAGVCYVALLLPMLGFANIGFMKYSLVADHYQYLAMIASCALGAAAVAFLGNCSGWRIGEYPRNAHTSRDPRTRVSAQPTRQFIGPVAVLTTLGTLTFGHGRVYHDTQALAADVLRKDPKCWLAYGNLASDLEHDGKADEAIKLFERALQLNPNSAEARCNMGAALMKRGQQRAAVAELQKAIAIRPRYPEAHYNLGIVYLTNDRPALAVDQFKQTLHELPDYAPAHDALGRALLALGQRWDALRQHEQAVRLRPNKPQYLSNYGLALAQIGQTQEALACLEEAVRRDPDDAALHVNLGSGLLMAGKFGPATDQYNRALDLAPDSADTSRKLAWLLATHVPADKGGIGSPARALALAQRACDLVGHSDLVYPVYLDTLGAAYAAVGQFAPAVDTAEKALNLAQSNGQTSLARDIEVRLALYRQEQPYRENTPFR